MGDRISEQVDTLRALEEARCEVLSQVQWTCTWFPPPESQRQPS
jgi:hypothetical protein